MKREYSHRLIARARGMRREPTPAERKLWFDFLRAHPTKFRRQVPLQGYILDFYAHAPALCIELDGDTHDTADAQAYDAERSAQLGANGIRVLRFQNREVMQHFTSVCERINQAIAERGDPSVGCADSSPERDNPSVTFGDSSPERGARKDGPGLPSQGRCPEGAEGLTA